MPDPKAELRLAKPGALGRKPIPKPNERARMKVERWKFFLRTEVLPVKFRQTMQDKQPALTIEVKHSGERLTLRRVRNTNGVEELHLSGTLPPHRQGPPLHIHFAEDEHGEVISGVLSASLDGKVFQVEAGGRARFPIGSTHRWWNGGDKELALQGVATPAVDLDRYLQALFEVINAGPERRPPMFYMAHVLHRHRHTQLALVIPRPVQRVLFPIIILLGSMLGKYRGTDWPGCPARCTGAPLTSDGPQAG